MRSRELSAKRHPPAPSPKAEAQKFPVHIRAPEVDLGTTERDYIRRKLGRKLGKYVQSTDASLRNLPSGVFESRDASLNAAVYAALSGTERAVRRTLERRRMKPLKRAVPARN